MPSPSATAVASTEVLARLERYAPRCLPAAQWALVGEAVRAGVLSAAPVDAEDTKGLASRVCLYLAGPCGWDRASVPDLAGLLAAGIDDHLGRLAAAGKRPKTLENHRADLARVARGLAGMPSRRGRTAQGASAEVSAVAAAVADLAVPLRAVAAAWEQLTGRSLRRDDLEPLGGLVAATAGCARPDRAGTVPGLSEAAALAAALDAVTTAGEVPANTPVPSPGAPATGRVPRPSRAAALRHARAAMAAAEQAAAGPVVAGPPDPASLAPGVADAITGFTPKDLPAQRWAELRPMWERLIVGYAPPTPGAVGNPASILARFCDWASRRPGRPNPAAVPTPEELLASGLVDAYDQHLAGTGIPDSSRATQRSVVRRALRSLDARKPSAKIAYQPVAGPYSPVEAAAMVRLARNQPTAARRCELCFVVGLGLGAGLDGRDLRHVNRSGFAEVEIGEDRPALAVTVAGGDRPRTVIVRRAYEPLVRDALGLHDDARRGKTAPILGRSATRRNITNPVMAHAVTARAGESIDIEVNRLRATWLVAAMCAPVPLATLLAAAGLRSARTLTDLLAHCPTPDPDQVAVALAHLEKCDPGQGPGRP